MKCISLIVNGNSIDIPPSNESGCITTEDSWIAILIEHLEMLSNNGKDKRNQNKKIDFRMKIQLKD